MMEAEENAWLSIGQSFPGIEKEEENVKNIRDDITTLTVYRHESKHKKKKKKHQSYRKHTSSEESSVSSDFSDDDSRKKSNKYTKKSKYHRKKTSIHSSHYKENENDSYKDSKKSKKSEKNESRKQKRLEDGINSSSIRSIAMLPKKVQKHEVNNIGSSDIFTLDRQGDQENLFFGSLYAKDMPKYHLHTRRIINTNNWVSSRLSANNCSFSQCQDENDRYFSEKSTKLERIARQKRLCLAYSEKRARRKLEEEQSSTGTALNYIPLDPILNDDEEEDEQNDEENREHSSLVRKTELQSKEQYIVFKTKEFNEKLSKNPHEISTWLDFISFQQEAADLLVVPFSNGCGNLLLSLILQVSSSSSSKSLKKKHQVAIDQAFEKQKAILKKAAQQNPTSRLLKQISLQFTLLDKIQQQQEKKETQHGISNSLTSNGNDFYEFIRVQLEKLLDQMGTSSSSIEYQDPSTTGNLWRQLVNWQEQNNFSSFTIQRSRDLYARIMYIYRKRMEQCWNALQQSTKVNKKLQRLVDLEATMPFNDEDLDRIVKQIHLLAQEMIRFHYQMCHLEIKSGFLERAIAQMQALCDVNLFEEGKILDLTRPGWEQTFETWYEEADSTTSSVMKPFGSDMTELEQEKSDSNETFERFIERLVIDKYMEEIQPSNEIFTKEHQNKLLTQALGQFIDVSSTIKGNSKTYHKNDELEERNTGETKKVYSNLHGYRIEVDDVDESEEYERILAELRGQPASIERQEVKQNKQLRQDQHRQKLLQRFRDQRIDFNHDNTKENSNRLSWFKNEAKSHMIQWIPLRSQDPGHVALIEDAPDRAIMAEEMTPFLFQVPNTFHLQLVWGLLRTLGIQIRFRTLHSVDFRFEEEEEVNEKMIKEESMCSFYMDDFEEMESTLVAPILQMLGSKLVTTSKEEGQLYWSVHETIHQLETKVLMQQIKIAVDPALLFLDIKRITMIRQVFQQALKYFMNLSTKVKKKQLEIALLQSIWIEFETLYIIFLREKGDNNNEIDTEKVEALRHKCQGFLEFFEQDFSSSASVLVWFAYAKMEWRLGYLTQVRRICDTLLISLRSQDYERHSALLERMIFLRLRCDLWLEGLHSGIPRGVQVALYVFLHMLHPSIRRYAPLPNELKKPKQFNKQLDTTWTQCTGTPSILKDLCLIYEQRIDQMFNTSECIQLDVTTSSHSGGDDSFVCKCAYGFLIHNYCVLLYVMEHFQLSTWNFQQHVSQVFEKFMDRLNKTKATNHLEWLSFCYLEYLQQYQLTSKRLTPFHWRSAVYKCIILQQHSSLSGLLLRLFINAEMTSSTAITSRNLRFFFEKEMVKSNQRVYKWPTSIQWIFALLCEFTRVDRIASATRRGLVQDDEVSNTAKNMKSDWCCLLHRWNGSNVLVDRIREMFEASVCLSSNRDTLTSQGLMMSLQHRTSAICWRLYIRFEVAMGKIEQAKRTLYRALTKCPWSLHLFHDAFQVLGKYLNEDEREEIIHLLQAKELHIRLES